MDSAKKKPNLTNVSNLSNNELLDLTADSYKTAKFGDESINVLGDDSFDFSFSCIKTRHSLLSNNSSKLNFRYDSKLSPRCNSRRTKVRFEPMPIAFNVSHVSVEEFEFDHKKMILTTAKKLTTPMKSLKKLNQIKIKSMNFSMRRKTNGKVKFEKDTSLDNQQQHQVVNTNETDDEFGWGSDFDDDYNDDNDQDDNDQDEKLDDKESVRTNKLTDLPEQSSETGRASYNFRTDNTDAKSNETNDNNSINGKCGVFKKIDMDLLVNSYNQLTASCKTEEFEVIESEVDDDDDNDDNEDEYAQNKPNLNELTLESYSEIGSTDGFDFCNRQTSKQNLDNNESEHNVQDEDFEPTIINYIKSWKNFGLSKLSKLRFRRADWMKPTASREISFSDFIIRQNDSMDNCRSELFITSI